EARQPTRPVTELSLQHLSSPCVEQPGVDAMPPRHIRGTRVRLQTLVHDLALLFHCPRAATLATRDHLDPRTTSAPTISRRSVLSLGLPESGVVHERYRSHRHARSQGAAPTTLTSYRAHRSVMRSGRTRPNACCPPRRPPRRPQG